MEDQTAIKRRMRLEELKNRYLAVNMRSRSLRLYRTSRSGAIDLLRLKPINPHAFSVFIERLGTQSRDPIPLAPIQPAEGVARAFADDLGALARSAREIEMETGAHELAVAWPILEGRCEDGAWLRAPLFLYPVTISTTSHGRVRWTVTFEGLPDCNASLLQLLERVAGIRLTVQDFLDKDEDGLFKIDPETWASMIKVLEEAELPLSETSSILPEPASLPPRSKEAREAMPRDQFTLLNHLVLGRFPRWGSTVVKDYETLIETSLTDDVLGLAAELLLVDEDSPWTEDNLHSTAPEDGTSSSATTENPATTAPPATNENPEDTRQWQVLPSDASQDAVLRVLDQPGRRGLVVQGPPGTGKSQLITNLVSAAIGAGRKVLLVCQKRAALDVVADRLAARGLGEPLAVVHDVERDRNRVFKSITQSLDHALGQDVAAKQSHNETQGTHKLHARARQRLSGRLRTAHEAYARLTQSQDGKPPLVVLQENALVDDGRPLPNLVATSMPVSLEQAHAALPALEALAGETQTLPTTHPLMSRRRWHNLETDALNHIFDTWDRIAECLEALEACHSSMSPAETLGYVDAWNAAAPVLDLVERDDPEDHNRFRFFWVWTEGDLSHGEWSRVMQRLTEAANTRKEVPPDLIRCERENVETDIQKLALLEELNGKWFHIFLPEWWTLKKLPEQLCRHTGIPTELIEDLPALRALCREGLAWMALIADLPIDMPFMDIGLLGDPSEINYLIDGLRLHHDRVRAVHDLHKALSEREGSYSEWPSIADVKTPLRQDPFFEAALNDRRTARLFGELGQMLDLLRKYFQNDLIDTILALVGNGSPHEALLKVKALQETRSDVPEVLRIDRLLENQPDWVWTFLLQWRNSRSGSRAGVAEDALGALERLGRPKFWTVVLPMCSRLLSSTPINWHSSPQIWVR